MWNLTITPDARTQARLHDLARQQAEHLRAAAIDDFWRGANAALTSLLPSEQARQQRSAQRLQTRLQRRQQTA